MGDEIDTSFFPPLFPAAGRIEHAGTLPEAKSRFI